MQHRIGIGFWRRVLQWPAKPTNRWVPWYVVLRRGTGAPFVIAGLLLVCVGSLVGWGWSAAKDDFLDNFSLTRED